MLKDINEMPLNRMRIWQKMSERC